MKLIPLLTIIALLGSASGSAQDAALPPIPGFTPSPTAAPAATPPAAPATTPPATQPADSDQAADTSTAATTTPGTPANGADTTVAAAETNKADTPASDTASSEVATPAEDGTSPGEAPPSSGEEPEKVDFLQRSNLILARLLENERSMDPFGLVMDPANAKAAPVLADQYEEVEETPQLNSSSLKNALLTLPITGIYPKRGMIVLGARTFEVGGQFGMKLQDLTIRLRFEGIRGGEIFFKDMETREVTSIPFNPRPAEFEPIAKGAKREPGQGISGMNDLFIAN